MQVLVTNRNINPRQRPLCVSLKHGSLKVSVYPVLQCSVFIGPACSRMEGNHCVSSQSRTAFCQDGEIVSCLQTNRQAAFSLITKLTMLKSDRPKISTSFWKFNGNWMPETFNVPVAGSSCNFMLWGGGQRPHHLAHKYRNSHQIIPIRDLVIPQFPRNIWQSWLV